MSNPQRKTEHIHIAVTPAMKDFLAIEAARRERSISEYVRELLERHSGYEMHIATQRTRRRMIDKALED